MTIAEGDPPVVDGLGLSSTSARWALGTIDSSVLITKRYRPIAPWTVDRLVVAFDQPVNVTTSSLVLTGRGGAPVNATGVAGAGTAEAIWAIGTVGPHLASDHWTVTLNSGVTSLADVPLYGGWTTGLSVLVGDVNGDGRVSSRDRRAMRDAFWAAAADAAYPIFADLNGDGRVSGRDRRVLRDHYAAALPDPPALPAAAPAATGMPSAGDLAGSDLIAAATLAAAPTGVSPAAPTASADAAMSAPPPIASVPAPSLDVWVVASPAETPSPRAMPPADSSDADAPYASQLEPDLSAGLIDPLG